MKRTSLGRKTPLRVRHGITSKSPIKPRRPKSTPARKAAQGKPCMVRLPGIFNHDPDTTVLAHYRLAGTCGTGTKPSDAQAAFACSACHDECDRRTRHLEAEFVRLCHAEGVMRTQQARRAES